MIGFKSIGRHFEHPESDHLVEFSQGPLFLGESSATEIIELTFDTGLLRVISPTDCVKDRLSHYYHWGDQQCLVQAKLVAENYDIDFTAVREWSKSEGKLAEFLKISGDLSRAK
jgi:hypothetical protein